MLGAQIHALWQGKRACSTSEALHTEMTQSLEAALERKWPGQGLTLRAFGSTQNGLGLLSSDLDLVLVDPSMPNGRWTAAHDRQPLKNGFKLTHQSGEDPLPAWYDVDVLADVFRHSSCSIRKATPIRSARVPIVKLDYTCEHCKDTLEIDVSINNLFCLYNSNLIKAYVSLRPNTLPPLFFAVKSWLKARGLNDPSGRWSNHKSLSSYAIALLVIQFLQIQGHLPNLQQPALVNLVPSKDHKRLHSSNDPHCPTLNAPKLEFVKLDTEWDVTFLDPAAAHVELLENAQRRIIVPKSDSSVAAHYPLFSLWEQQRHHESHRLPHPREVGLHKSDPTTIHAIHKTLGTLFVSFVSWFESVLTHRRAVDIATGCDRAQNTDESEEVYRRWCLSRAKNNNSSVARLTRPSYYNPDDPLEWQEHALVIADPFILHQNVARNVTQAVKNLLIVEVQRARRRLCEQKRGFEDDDDGVPFTSIASWNY